MSTEAKTASTKVVTGLVRLSYAHIWEPVAIEEGATKKYSVSLIIPKSDTETVAKIKAAIEAAKEEGKKSKFGGKIPTSNFKTPLRDGDVDRPEDDAYANAYFLNANATTKPGIVDKNVNPILEQDEVYSGCYGRVSVTFYPFNTSGNKGIACGLNHIQKIKEGDPLSGRGKASDDFNDGFEADDLL